MPARQPAPRGARQTDRRGGRPAQPALSPEVIAEAREVAEQWIESRAQGCDAHHRLWRLEKLLAKIEDLIRRLDASVDADLIDELQAKRLKTVNEMFVASSTMFQAVLGGKARPDEDADETLWRVLLEHFGANGYQIAQLYDDDPRDSAERKRADRWLAAMRREAEALIPALESGIAKLDSERASAQMPDWTSAAEVKLLAEIEDSHIRLIEARLAWARSMTQSK